MATLVKTPAGWKAVVRRTGWPTASKSFATKRDAEDWARGVEVDMRKGLHVDRAISIKMSIKEALERYRDTVTPNKKPSTQKAEVGAIRGLIADLGNYTLAGLTQERVAKYRDSETERGMSANTVRLKLALLSNLFTVAGREWGIGLNRNPVSQIAKPRCVSRDRRLSDAELNLILSECRKHSNPMLAWIVELLLTTGMRKSELINLSLSDVDLTKRIASLRDTKNGTARTVPLSMRATELFHLALANQMRPSSTKLVFFGATGKDGIIRPYTFDKLFFAALKSTGIEDFHLHDLRHEATSRLVEKGLTDQQVSSISGHKSMQMLKRYTHLRAEDLLELLG